MKKFLLVLLVLLLAVTMTALFVACDKEDPCKDGHSYDDGEIVQPATCNEEGTLLKRCTRCGATVTEAIPATNNHLWDSGVVTQPATCKDSGSKTLTCTECGTTKTETIAPNDDHDYGALIPEEPATCGEDGTQAHYKCSVCDKLFIEEDGVKKEVDAAKLVIPATNQHDYTEQPYLVDGANGHYQLCKNCQKPGATVKHSLTYENLDEAQHRAQCSVCNYEATTDHDWDNGTPNPAPTCESTGSMEYHCQASGCNGTKTVIVGATGHNGVLQPGKPATCNQPGYGEYYKCENCNKFATEKDGDYIYDTEEAVQEAVKQDPTNAHSYDGQPFIDDHNGNHYQECAVCGQQSASTSHELEYTPVAGERKHTEKCSRCDYEAVKDCSVGADNICPDCHADYTVRATVKVHFHAATGWQVSRLKLYAYIAGDGDAVTELLGAFPGTGTFTDDSDSGWYVCTFEVADGVVGEQDLVIIVNDKVKKADSTDYDGVQTANLHISAAEVWVPGIIGGENVYDSAAGALAAEQNVPTKDDWFISGFFNGESEWVNTVGGWSRVFTAGNEWQLTSDYAAKQSFKVVKNDGSWTSKGYDEVKFTFEDTIEGDTTKLFTRGAADTMDNNNIIVNYTCRLQITFHDETFEVHALSAEGLPAKSDTNVDNYYLVGAFNGVECWSDGTGKKMNYNSADGTYSITVDFKNGDTWKVKKQDSSVGKNDNWQYGIDAADMTANRITVDFGSVTKPSTDLFTGEDNIKVHHDCTVTIVYKPSSDRTTITVTALTESKETFEYHFWLYVGSSWSSAQKVYIWAWGESGAISTNSGDITSHPMDNIGGGWFHYKYTDTMSHEGKTQNLIMVACGSSWSNEKGRVMFNNSPTDGNGKQVTIHENMYFDARNTGVQYDSWDKTTATAAPSVEKVTLAEPVQVVFLPTELIRKSDPVWAA